METVITVLHVLVCLFLIIVVLLQPGKGGDVAAAFGGGSSQSVFGSRGATTFLQKLTSAVAALFMVTTVTLAYFASEGTRGGSVIDTEALEKEQQPVQPVVTPESPAGAAAVPPPAEGVPAAMPADVAPVEGAAGVPAMPVPPPAAPADAAAPPVDAAPPAQSAPAGQ